MSKVIDRKRFILNAKSKSDRIVSIFIAAVNGDRLEAIGAIKSLNLTSEEIETWSDEECAIAHYFANRLACYNLAFKKEIFAAWSVKGYKSPSALGWHQLIRQDTGYDHLATATSHKFAIIPGECDGVEFILWMLGVGNKPTQEPWVEVPFG